jgi:uncharacterized protein (DUF3084 family)
MNRLQNRLPEWHIDRCLSAWGGDQEALKTQSKVGHFSVNSCYITIYLDETRLEIVNSKLQILDMELQMVNSKLQILDMELQVVNSKLQILDMELQIVNSKLQILDMELQIVNSKLQNVDMKLQNVDSKLQNLDLKLQNHAKTADRDRRSWARDGRADRS